MLAFVLFGLFSITMCVNSVEKCFNTTGFCVVLGDCCCSLISGLYAFSSDILLCSSLPLSVFVISTSKNASWLSCSSS